MPSDPDTFDPTDPADAPVVIDAGDIIHICATGLDPVMSQPWVCVLCRLHVTFGELRTCGQCQLMHCPRCHSTEVSPADGRIVELTGDVRFDPDVVLS